ncbi:hypothetical protein D4R75_08355 [bacterium]|nr:MAG: hypothetical protein D4R75_08355 [bacterium]
MGIDHQGLNLLKFAYKKRGGLGRVATIGRQVLMIPKKKWKNLLPPAEFNEGDYVKGHEYSPP